MKTLRVGLEDRGYNINIGHDLLGQLGQFLPRKYSKACLLITDENVDKLYGKKVEETLTNQAFHVSKVVVAAGETSKSLETAARLYDCAFDHKMDRKSPIIALGGGVVGDLAGFIAATYMRGVPFIQIPTSLLAQVDSSVGGKVAVNHPRGKNIIGAFYQPQLVLIDLSVLKTLPPRELRAGMAEVIKYGIIWDKDLFSFLERNLERLLSLEAQIIEEVVYRCCDIKAAVVEQDEKEANVRAVLNFGHTVGHAVEALGNYELKKHGEAVAVGMVMAGKISVDKGLFEKLQLERMERLLTRVPLDVNLPPEWAKDKGIELMLQDKKASQGKINFVLPEEIGKVRIEEISASELHNLL